MQRSLRFGSSSSTTFFALALALASYGCGGSTTNGGGPSGDDDAGGTKADASGGGKDGGSNETDSSIPPPPDGVVAVPLLTCVPLVYGADFSVGGQDFRFIVDTGSTSLGVAGESCSNCQVSPLYKPGSTAVDQKQKANSQFGSGSWSGEIFEDAVGPTAADSVPVKLVSITSQTGFFQQGSTCGGKPYQGLLGLSQAASAVQGTNGFFDQYVAKKGVADIFSTELCDDGGTLWLGGYDSAAMSAAPQYVPFTNDFAASAYYSVELQSVSVAGTTVAISTPQYTDSIVDTGTSVWLLGSTAYSKLSAAIAATDGFKKLLSANFFASQGGQPSCADLKQTKAEIDSTLPSLTLTFAGGVTAQAVATESYLMPFEGLGYCNALVGQPQSQNFPIASLMGAPILRSNVFIYDRAKSRLGIAPHAPCPSARTMGMSAAAPASPATLKPRIGYPMRSN